MPGWKLRNIDREYNMSWNHRPNRSTSPPHQYCQFLAQCCQDFFSLSILCNSNHTMSQYLDNRSLIQMKSNCCSAGNVSFPHPRQFLLTCMRHIADSLGTNYWCMANKGQALRRPLNSSIYYINDNDGSSCMWQSLTQLSTTRRIHTDR